MISATELKSVDLYRKILGGLTEARLSIMAVLSMMLLFGMEPCYLAVSASTFAYKSSDHYYLRNFNTSFPEVSYGFASNDMSDVMETERINIAETDLDSNSRPTGIEFRSGTVTNAVKHDDEVDRESDEGSFSLTTLNFDNYVNQFPITVVNFYVPWCSWSKRLKPAWEKTAKIMKHRYDPEIDGRIIFAKVDCTLEEDLCRRHHIQGYPSIRVFRQGSDVRSEHGQHVHEAYYGDRDTESLVQFMENLVAASLPIQVSWTNAAYIKDF